MPSRCCCLVGASCATGRRDGGIAALIGIGVLTKRIWSLPANMPHVVAVVAAVFLLADALRAIPHMGVGPGGRKTIKSKGHPPTSFA